MATSKDVADFFGKRHDNVMQSIAELVRELTPEKSGVWFVPTTYKQRVGYGLRDYASYEMTRDGFTLLAMGFTGKKALQFKLA